MNEQKIGVIVAQVFISCLMALIMTFLFSILPHGFGGAWFATWMRNWLTAWPVAFVLSLMVGPLSFAISRNILRLTRRTT